MTTNARHTITSVVNPAAIPTITAAAKPTNEKQVAITLAGMAEHSFAQKANPLLSL
ncbi:MAG: hypothetical protein JKX85_06110 [Phycisphaeraceae bacterium]|nr:hypothetical protein [Phycisphaeraceae bacterium]